MAEPVDVGAGWHPDPARSTSLHASAYVEEHWFAIERDVVFSRSWQWLAHGEAVREPGQYVAAEVAGSPICVVRGNDGELRGFFNVCRHRGHELLDGRGATRAIVCPYHAWTYDLTGTLVAARHSARLIDFDPSSICLEPVAVEEFAGFVFVNLDRSAPPLASQSGDLAAEMERWAPDVDRLTFSRRLEYDIAANWKCIVDNFLECYHCHVAHNDFVSLVDMETYRVTTHGIYSSHMARAGTESNSAYDVSDATVTDHAVWWLWPNTCIMRYPGRGNLIVMQIIPVEPGRSRETYDFFLESPEPTAAELDSMRYLDDVLQPEDIALVESVQRGMRSPGFEQGRIVAGAPDSGLSEHAVHHFHGLLLEAYGSATT